MVLGWSCAVAIRVQEHLGVGVDGEESLDVPVGLHKVHNGLDFRLGMSHRPMVCL